MQRLAWVAIVCLACAALATARGRVASHLHEDPAPAASTCPDGCSEHGYCLANECLCHKGWTGANCGTAACENDCSGHGACTDGVCQCAVGYGGPDCSYQACFQECNGGGYCSMASGKFDAARCVCLPGRKGPACEQYDNAGQAAQPCGEDNLCSGRGVCHNAVCACQPPYTGHDCSLLLCPENCGGKGECNVNTGECRCTPPFLGPDCKTAKCPDDCNGNGVCDTSTGQCTCKDGFYRPSCEQTKCPENCHGRGKCLHDEKTDTWACDCEEGWITESCKAEKPCEAGCDKHGVCHRGVCYCQHGWIGSDCLTARDKHRKDGGASKRAGCDPPCKTSNGVCMQHKDAWRCLCRDGYMGVACEDVNTQGANIHRYDLGKTPGKDEESENDDHDLGPWPTAATTGATPV